jgi:hypothetical protein
MRALLRRPAALPWAIALAFTGAVLLLGSREVFWNADFSRESLPAYQALIDGHPGEFFSRLPAYAGFATAVGGPAALLTGLFGRDETMVFRLIALPGLMGLAAIGAAIASPARAAGRRFWWLFAVMGAGGALTYSTLTYGHPEDLLAAAGAIGAVLVARSGRTGWAGALLVVAVLAKQWAVLAILPAAFAAPRGALRIAATGAAGALVALALPVLLTRTGGAPVTSTGLLFHPHQVWWPFGAPATPDFIKAGHGTRMGPEWLQPLTRPLIVGAGAALALLWRRRAGAERNRDDALGVLALALLLRCMLDPWDLVYYHLPLIVALAAWEARRGRELPVLAVVASACAWLTFVVYDARSGYGPYLAYMAWTVPLALGLALRLLRGAHRLERMPAAAAPAPA